MIPSASRYEGPANKECARAPAWVGFISLMRLGIPLGGMAANRGASRPAARLLGDDTTPDDHAIPADDDARWRAGVFYANADDPALVVPKRFGVGWTLSWARPTSWIIVTGTVALVIIFCVLAGALV